VFLVVILGAAMSTFSFEYLKGLDTDLVVRQNTINLDGDVDVKMALGVREALLYFFLHGSPDINVVITSHGGNAHFGLNIAYALKMYKGKVDGLVFGRADSMAFVILQACDTRRAVPETRFTPHHVYTNGEGVQLHELEDERKFSRMKTQLAYVRNQVIDIIAARSKISRDQVVQLLDLDESINAETALDCGFIDQIINPFQVQDQD